MASRTTPVSPALPDQTGRIVVVTGASSGIGFHTAIGLARAGARVVMACRNPEKTALRRSEILDLVPGAAVDIVPLDLADLASVKDAARTLVTDYERIDVLVNNAGVMLPPHTVTVDGFELQLATNYLGHFALTLRVLPRMLDVPRSRVISLGSVSHTVGRIDFDDLQSEHRYSAARAYAQSKLACVMFGYELQRRLTAAGAHTESLIADPGVVASDLARTSPPLVRWFFDNALPALASAPSTGALPTLRAATDRVLPPGRVVGPAWRRRQPGRPVLLRSAARGHDAATQRRLWEVSERLTGVRLDRLAHPIPAPGMGGR